MAKFESHAPVDIDAEQHNIQQHLDKGNYHAAINLAISAMNACRKNEDQHGVDIFIQLMRTIIDTLANEFSSNK